MKQEQKQTLFDCIVILKGSASTDIMKLPDNDIIKMLEKECADTMGMFWDLVHENKKLKEKLNVSYYLYYYDL